MMQKNHNELVVKEVEKVELMLLKANDCLNLNLRIKNIRFNSSFEVKSFQVTVIFH